jgi:rubredoxin-NAD+ reductase
LGAGAGFGVCVSDPAPWLIGNLVAPEQGRALQRALAKMGVEFCIGDLVEKIERSGAGSYHLGLRCGRSLRTDLILSAVGLEPRVELAQQASLVTARGIQVDAMGRTNAPHIFAPGDCAACQLATEPGSPTARPGHCHSSCQL